MRNNYYFFKCSATIGISAFLLSLKDTVVISNGNYWDFFNEFNYLKRIESSVQNRFFNTGLENNSIIFGSENDLKKCLGDLSNELKDIKLLAIIADSASSLIGDDVCGITQRVLPDMDVINLDGGGLQGSFSDGFEKCAIKVLEKYALNTEYKNNTVNVLGLSDFYFNGITDRKEIVRILEKAGYEINVVLGGSNTIEDISKIGSSSLNIVCNEELSIKTAKYLEKRFGTPYIIVGLPFGFDGTKQWIQAINKALPNSNTQSMVNECLEMKKVFEKNFDKYLDIYGNLYLDKVVISASGTYAQCLAQCLRSELFNIGNLIVIQSTPATKQYCNMADKILTVGNDDSEIENLLKTNTDCVFLGNGLDYLNLRNRKDCKFAFLNIQYPVVNEVMFSSYPYVGTNGALVLIEKIWNNYINSF